MDSNKLIPKNDKYFPVYGDQFTKKIDYLTDVIINKETGKDKFLVLALEAGFGKSFYTDKIIEQFYESVIGTKRKFLIVKKFNTESYISSRVIDHPFVVNRVAVVTSESWQTQWRNDKLALKNMQVIIMSHQRYINLCLNDKDRELFEFERDTLIIDEKVNFPHYTYSDPFYSDARKLISHINRSQFDEVCDVLNTIIQTNKKNSRLVQNIRPTISKKKFSEFTKMLNGEINNQSDTKKKNLLTEFLDTVIICFDENINKILNSNKIVGFNPKHKHWGLNNNIILDASAYIDGVYGVNECFQVNRQTPIIDHSQSSFIHVKVNSSQYNITQNKESYFDKITKLIKEREVDGERTLLVLAKGLTQEFYQYASTILGKENIWIDKVSPEDSDYNNQPYAIAWYGNLIGKNWAKDFDNVWLLSTPNIPYSNYLIQYQQYSGRPVGHKGLGIDEYGKFKNPIFRSVQVGYIAAEMYQALKRIQRNPKPKGKFYIVNSDVKVVEKIISPIKNAEINETFEIELHDKEKVITKQQSIVNYMLDLVKTSDDKSYIYKKDVKEVYGAIKWSRITSDPKIIELKKQGKLVEQQKYFVVHTSRCQSLKA